MIKTITKPLINTLAPWKGYVNSLIASEISSFTRYYDKVVQYLPRQNDSGILLDRIEASSKEVISSVDAFPDLTVEKNRRTAILLNGTVNHHFDIHALLTTIKPKLARTSRLILVTYNPYMRWLYSIANYFGIREGELPSTFVTRVDLQNIAKLAGYEIVRARPSVYIPWRIWGVGEVINRMMPCFPGVRWLSFAFVATLRPIVEDKKYQLSLSCIIPARNERGNIENALKRLDGFSYPLEVIFVEGHSSDGTWKEIQRVSKKYQDKYDIKTFRQTGKGKGDAVRLGFAQAKGDLLTILDADLTMPPELLERFYDAYCEGCGDFVNGSRLVYPMEGRAMRFLNKLGNVFFAKALSSVLGARLGDTLCGTKLVAKHDYERMVAWRETFGDFDPFGDFELLFPAAVLGLGIVDIPIRYRDRTYGQTNISRFRHGLMLAKMTLIGFLFIRCGAGSGRVR